jgi:hypothetical protein
MQEERLPDFTWGAATADSTKQQSATVPIAEVDLGAVLSGCIDTAVVADGTLYTDTSYRSAIC